VREGQWVKPGERLVEIENLGLQARLATTARQLALLRYENGLFNQLIDNGGRLPALLPPPPANIAKEERVRSVQLTVQQLSSQLRQLQERVSSQQQTLKLKQSLAESLESIYLNGGFAKYSYLQARDEVQQIKSQVSQTKEQINILISEAGRQVSGNDRQILNLEADRIGQQEARTNLILKASGAGRVFNLALRPGSVIGSGTELMRIVPEGALRARVFLANSDLGFVREGQQAKLSISSFPAGEYGYLDAKVTRIGADALDSQSQVEQQKANTYPLQVTLGANPTKTKLLTQLHPGMQVSALIIVRQRPVINLFTDVFTKGTEGLKNSR
jgi:HlyD family secretion protein